MHITFSEAVDLLCRLAGGDAASSEERTRELSAAAIGFGLRLASTSPAVSSELLSDAVRDPAYARTSIEAARLAHALAHDGVAAWLTSSAQDAHVGLMVPVVDLVSARACTTVKAKPATINGRRYLCAYSLCFACLLPDCNPTIAGMCLEHLPQ